MILPLLLAAAPPPVATVPARFVELDCEMAVRGRTAQHQKWRTSIRFDIEGRRIASVLLDGPDPFTSYATVGRDSPSTERRKLLHKKDRWSGHFQKNAIRLRRWGVDLVLEMKDDPAGALSGFWTHIHMIENRPIEVNGTIACRHVAGTLAGNS